MTIKVVFLLLIIVALMVVRTDKLRRAVVYLGVLSMIGAYSYLLYAAPDVAIAEAVIGSTLSTILYLVALQKYAVFTIYYVHPAAQHLDDREIRRSRGSLLSLIERFLTERELEPQIIYTVESPGSIRDTHHHDLIIERDGSEVRFHGPAHSYLTEGIMDHVESHMREMTSPITVTRVPDGADDSAMEEHE